MSLFVLDTDIVSLYRQNHAAVHAQVKAHQFDDVRITVLTVEEHMAGWYAQLRRARMPQDVAAAYLHIAESVPFLAQWPILPFTEPAIARFKQLKGLRLNVGGMDLSIASITLENNGILVTRNLRDFQRVPNLTVENWAV